MGYGNVCGTLFFVEFPFYNFSFCGIERVGYLAFFNDFNIFLFNALTVQWLNTGFGSYVKVFLPSLGLGFLCGGGLALEVNICFKIMTIVV